MLVHEAAHIARGDWLSQAIGQLACELFWFHPLVWRAFTRLRDEAERAADDCVLRSGMPAAVYATHLLELARRTTNARPELVAVGIVSTNELERRFVAMFDNKRSRTTVTSRVRAVTASFALAIVCPLASLRVAAPVARTNALQPEMRATIVPHPVPEPLQASIAVVDDSAPRPIVHPDFSGRWKQDTVAGPEVESFVTDSMIITQSENAISFQSRAHVLDAPYRNLFHNITFDGAESTGLTVLGNEATNFVASAVWVGDTLVLKTYAHSSAHDALTYERITLSPDGNTLLDINRSFADGRSRYGGPHTFVLRRIAP